MKKNETYIPLIVGGFLLFLFVRRRTSLITYEAVKVPFQKLTTSGIELDIILPINNGSGFAATIQNFQGNVIDANGSALAYVALSNPQQIPSLGRVELKFKTTITWTSLASEVVDIVKQNGKLSLGTYRVKGVLIVSGGIRIPIDQPLF